MSHEVEAAAGPAGLWISNILTSNRFLHGLPGVAILDWLTVGWDFVLPLLMWTDTRSLPARLRVTHPDRSSLAP